MKKLTVQLEKFNYHGQKMISKWAGKFFVKRDSKYASQVGSLSQLLDTDDISAQAATDHTYGTKSVAVF